MRDSRWVATEVQTDPITGGGDVYGAEGLRAAPAHARPGGCLRPHYGPRCQHLCLTSSLGDNQRPPQASQQARQPSGLSGDPTTLCVTHLSCRVYPPWGPVTLWCGLRDRVLVGRPGAGRGCSSPCPRGISGAGHLSQDVPSHIQGVLQGAKDAQQDGKGWVVMTEPSARSRDVTIQASADGGHPGV